MANVPLATLHLLMQSATWKRTRTGVRDAAD